MVWQAVASKKDNVAIKLCSHFIKAFMFKDLCDVRCLMQH